MRSLHFHERFQFGLYLDGTLGFSILDEAVL